jgi:hypothetical protein
MVFGFLDALPTWAVGVAICGIAVLLTTLAQATLHRRWSVEARKPLNEITGFVIAVVGVIYAVLLASIAILAIERYDKAQDIVDTEAGLVGDIYRNAIGLPPPVRTEIRQALTDYAETVVDVEWTLMARGEQERGWQEHGWQDLETVLASIAQFEPQTVGQQLFMDEILDQISGLNDARRARMFLSENPIDSIIWWVVVLGGVSTVSLALLFGVQSAGHFIVSNVLAFSIGLVILLIFVMDRPFTGSSPVTVEPFVYVQERLVAVPSSQ